MKDLRGFCCCGLAGCMSRLAGEIFVLDMDRALIAAQKVEVEVVGS